MPDEHENDHSTQQKPPQSSHSWFTLPILVALIIIVIIGYYLIAEHKAHISGFFAGFPWLLLVLLCPLMHLMHGGHGGSHHRDNKKNKNSSEHKE